MSEPYGEYDDWRFVPPSLRTHCMTMLRGRSLRGLAPSGKCSLGECSPTGDGDMILEGPAIGEGAGDVIRLDCEGILRLVSTLLTFDEPAPVNDAQVPSTGREPISFVDLLRARSCRDRRFFSRTEPSWRGLPMDAAPVAVAG